MDVLIWAYLEWKYPVFGPNNHSVEDSSHIFQIEAFSTLTRTACIDILQQNGEYANESLLHVGFLGCTPSEPALAISLDTQELFHHLKRHHPRLSVQAMVHTLSDIHNVRISLFYDFKFSISCRECTVYTIESGFQPRLMYT